ncbi:MAG: MoaD/ThiS family protein [Deltaproteobacteria bacterium]|nr:MAG: MoaD/ThiS family protein [Deltaproteobacteria bacterium]
MGNREVIRVNVKLFVTLRKYIPDYDPEKGINVDMKEGSTIKDLIETLGLPPNEASVIFINGISKKTTDHIKDGCHIKIFTPLAGG